MFKKALFSALVLLVFVSFVKGEECEGFIPQDFNCDGIVNMVDLAIFSEHWLDMATLNPDFYKNAVIGDNPTHYWRFGEGEGAISAIDEVGGRDLDISDTYAVPGQTGLISNSSNKAMLFQRNGVATNGLISTGGSLFPGGSNPAYSIEMWMYTENDFYRNSVFLGYPVTGSSTIYLQAQSLPSAIAFWGYVPFVFVGPISVTPGQNHHIVATSSRDASNNETIALYLDGILKQSYTYINTSDVSSVVSFDLMRGIVGSDIICDELAIYHTALTPSQVSNHYFAAFQNVAGSGIPGTGAEYGGTQLGGKWYYTHNTHGTKWFDTVDNKKGWTTDFNLKVNEVVNTDWVLDEDLQKGVGLYINDGTHRESVNFLTQEINFYHADKKVTYDTTSETDYRLIGKEDSLQLFAKKTDEDTFSEIANTVFPKKASDSGNGFRPSVFEDIYGIVHATWFDDGNKTGQIYYSYFSNTVWSTPELVVTENIGAQNPDILVDNDGTVYIIYESKRTEDTAIALIYKNSIGWGQPNIVDVADDRAKVPKATFDSQFNVFIAWEDHRQVHPEIYIIKFSKTLQKFEERTKITTTEFGAYNPSISSYLDDIFVSYTKKDPTENTSVELMKYFALTGKFSDSIPVSTVDELVDFSADFSNILVNVAGKVFVVWHSRVTGRFEIYLAKFSVDLTRVQDNTLVTNSRGGARFPVLSEHQVSADVYIVWQDFKTGEFTEFDPLILMKGSDEYGDFITEDEYMAREEGEKPLDSTIYVALYINLSDTLVSSATGSFDVFFNFPLDDRSGFFPSVPSLFVGEMPVVYESPFSDVSDFVPVDNFFNQIRSVFYNLSRTQAEYNVTNGISKITDPSFDTTDRDYEITGQELRKEIRFGDFSDSMNSRLLFKNFKYYTSDAVEPFSIVEINADNFPVARMTAHDASINNYGDVWIVGTCGMLYYINSQNRLVLLQEEDDAELKGPIGNVKAIAFDKYGYMYVGNDTGIYVSTEHVNGFKNIKALSNVTSLCFDKDNNLYVGTGKILLSGGGSGSVSIFSVKDNNSVDTDVPVILTELKSSTVSGSNLPSEFVTAIQADENNIIWICTYNGLFRLFRNQVLKFDTSSGFPSNRINDITIRNTAIRYVATTNGIVKMVGSNVDELIRSDGDRIWNGNTKCVLWQEPNVLWAGTMSKVNQIIINDVDRTYSTSIYEPSPSSGKNDFRTFYIINDDPVQAIEPTDIVEARLNGNLLPRGSFGVGFDNKVDQKIIRFKTPLNNDDIVEVVVRKDLVLKSEFKQTPQEKSIAGNRLIRIKDLAVANDLFYVVTEGSENEVKVNDSNNKLPFDKVHLDTTAPKGSITIGDIIDRSVVNVDIDILSSGFGDGENGSGVDRMVVSNYSNFTTDGTTLQTPILFSSFLAHDLGLLLEEVSTTFDFTTGTGTGLVIEYFLEINQLYAGTSNPGESAKLLKFNFTTQAWEEIVSYSGGEFVDFITRYNNLLVVSVGHSGNVARIFVYEIVFSGDVFDSLLLVDTLPILESRAFSFQEVNNLLYIGSGVGEGDEHGFSSGNDGGKVYVYDGFVINEVVSGLDENVYGLTIVENSSNLIAVTGPSGFVYEVDINNTGSFIIYNSTSAIISTRSINIGSQNLIFVGSKGEGVIRRSENSSSSFDVSIKTIAGDVNALKIFKINDIDVLYASIGKVLYYLSEAGSWVWRYTHTEDIKDVAFNNGNKDIYVISESKINKLKPLLSEKCIYLKLIDRAGNESIIDETLPTIDNPFVDCITIETLRDFINENKLFELDQFGSVVFNLTGNSAFYSGQKIDEERGTFISEIFDGTNDLVKWEIISWKATELTNTQVLVYVRVSDSNNDILLKDWVGPYTNSQSSAVDISSLSGQFIQFKVDLISNRKDVTPSFHSANIIAVTTEAVHFFTTNFVLPSNITKGILTSRKLLPVSADVVFALNTTNSVDFSDYQIIEEDRLFNMNQTGKNLRVGIKFISPSRGDILPVSFGEYGPYGNELFVNTINFSVLNSAASAQDYHFQATLYEDVGLTIPVFSTFSKEDQSGFSAESQVISPTGLNIGSGDEVDVFLNIPGAFNIECNTYYYIKVESTVDDGVTFETVLSNRSFITGCTTSFVDIIDFDFTNEQAFADEFHFRIRFYEDPERTSLFLTEFSGNNRTGWFSGDLQVSESGVSMTSNDTVNIVFRPDLTQFEVNKVLYLTIDSFNGSNFNLASNSFTFQARDVQNSIYCGGYSDVPVVKNFALMFELDNNELVTLNI